MQLRRRPLTSGAQTFLRTGAAAAALILVVHVRWLGIPDLKTLWQCSVGGTCQKRCTGSTRRTSTLSVDGDSTVWTYTAYFDEAASAIDVISETAVQPFAKPYYCHVWSERDGQDDNDVSGDDECSFAAETANVLSVNPGERRSLLTVLRCRNNGDYAFDSSTRLAIADSESCQRGRGAAVPVHRRPRVTETPASGRTVQFAVCCLPEWDAEHEIVEPENLISFIESNSKFGAGRFYFYNSSNSTTKILDHILRQYAKDGKVTVVQWPKRLDAFSLKAARQDCMHRSSAEADYVVYLSLSDFLVPTSGATWKDIVDQSQVTNPAAYLFSNVIIGVPSPKPCPILNSSMTQIAAKVKSLRYTLFGGVSGVANGDSRFQRTMYNLARVRTHPSVYVDWLTRANASTGDGRLPKPLVDIIRLDASSATVNHYNEQALVAVGDSRRLRRLPLRYSTSLCEQSNLVLGSILTGCPSCSRQ